MLEKYMQKNQIPIVWVNIIAIAVFSVFFAKNRNFEFMIYIVVIIFFMWLFIYTNKRVRYPSNVLWALTIWSILHMAGGGIKIGDDVLYAKMIYEFIGEPYSILKYDQIVHVYGFGVATLVMFHVIKPILNHKYSWTRILIVISMAGLGLGALNEIIEFGATVLVPETGVGGYINTSLDSVFNLIGALVASTYIYYSEKNDRSAKAS